MRLRDARSRMTNRSRTVDVSPVVGKLSNHLRTRGGMDEPPFIGVEPAETNDIGES